MATENKAVAQAKSVMLTYLATAFLLDVVILVGIIARARRGGA